VRRDSGRATLAPALLVLLAAAAADAAGPRQVIDAREAGARGDAIVDDAPALQAALDRLATSGGVLRLPGGTYILGAPLVVRGDDVTIRGDDGGELRAAKDFRADAAGALVRNEPPRGAEAQQRSLAIVGVTLDGAGMAGAGVVLERVRDVRVRDDRVRRLRAGGTGAIVVRSSTDEKNDAAEITVADNTIELDQTTSGIVLRNVVNCRVSGNRVQGTGKEGGHGLDLTLSRGCTISDNIVLSADVGVLTDETNEMQVVGNYVFSPRTGFQAEQRPGGRRPANNNTYVSNRVLTGGRGFVVRGSGMMLVANYAAFLKPGPAIWVEAGGTHDVVVANNPSVAEAEGIRFDASDGAVVGNVPISNGTSGIEVNGQRVAVSANAIVRSPVGIRLGDGARACTVLGNSIENTDTALALGGRDHRVQANTGPQAALPERGPGATYGTGEQEVSGVRTTVAADFPDDRYVVEIEWAADPGAREWVAEKTRTGFVIALPKAPPTPVRARWLARGF